MTRYLFRNSMRWLDEKASKVFFTARKAISTIIDKGRRNRPLR